MIKRSSNHIKPGKKTKSWTKARNLLKKQSVERGVTFCEFRFPGCHGEIDGYSHPKKRRFTKESELMGNVVGCCNFCHAIVENHDDKELLHLQAIAAREERYYQAA